MCLPPYKTKKLNSSKHKHVAYKNDRIEMLITNFKIAQYFNAVILICNMHMFCEILIFGLIRGLATLKTPVVFRFQNPFQVSQGFILAQ